MEDQVKVYTLSVVNGKHYKHEVVVFSSNMKRERHIMDLVLRCEALDKEYKDRLKRHADLYNFDNFVKLFRAAQVENSQPIGFDLYWEAEPQILL